MTSERQVYIYVQLPGTLTAVLDLQCHAEPVHRGAAQVEVRAHAEAAHHAATAESPAAALQRLLDERQRTLRRTGIRPRVRPAVGEGFDRGRVGAADRAQRRHAHPSDLAGLVVGRGGAQRTGAPAGPGVEGLQRVLLFDRCSLPSASVVTRVSRCQRRADRRACEGSARQLSTIRQGWCRASCKVKASTI